MAAEGGADRRTHRDAAAGHAFADIVVGVAGQGQLDAAGVPDAEALPGGAGEVRLDRIGCHPLIAVYVGDRAGQHGAHGAVGVANVEVEGFTLLRFDVRFRLRQQLFVQQTLVERRVAAFGTVHRFARMRRGGCQQRRQIQLVLLGGNAVQLGQELGAADQIHQLAHAQLRHDLAGFTRDKLEVIRHAFRQAVVVIAAQLVVLSRNAGRAVVEVADAQVFTAQRHHRPGAEAEAFRTQDRRFDDVHAGFQTAVHLQADLVAQAVGHQRLLGFHQAQFPWAAGIFHRGQRAGAGAAVVTGDGDQIGIGFRHAGGDGAHARLGHQFHRDHRLRVDLLQIEDQLRQIFDRVDVVVRRRGDQRHARHRVTQSGDVRGDFIARQLAAFARLGALRHLNLDHVGVHQVGRRHAEAAGGHLFDARHLVGAVARRIFAAFAGVGEAAEAVHGDRQ